MTLRPATTEACTPTAPDNRGSSPPERRLLSYLPSPASQDATPTFEGDGAPRKGPSDGSARRLRRRPPVACTPRGWNPALRRRSPAPRGRHDSPSSAGGARKILAPPGCLGAG